MISAMTLELRGKIGKIILFIFLISLFLFIIEGAIFPQNHKQVSIPEEANLFFLISFVFAILFFSFSIIHKVRMKNKGKGVESALFSILFLFLFIIFFPPQIAITSPSYSLVETIIVFLSYVMPLIDLLDLCYLAKKSDLTIQ